MNNKKSLRKFGTIYLWIFVIEVLQVCGDAEYRTDTEGKDSGAVVPVSLMKPYAYQIFADDYTDDLINEPNGGATPLWRTLNKQQHLYYKRLPFVATKTQALAGNSMTSGEINLENLNDFDSYKTKNTIWPALQQQQQQQPQLKPNDYKPRRHSLQEFFILRNSLGDDGRDVADIRYEQNLLLPLPIIMKNHYQTKAAKAIKKSKTSYNDGGAGEGYNVKENVFPLRDDDSTFNVANDGDAAVLAESENRVGVTALADAHADADEENGIANSNGNGNESLNYSDNKEANTNNMMMAQSSGNDHNRDSNDKQEYARMNINHQMRRNSNKSFDKRAKPSLGHTPFLPAVSGGAMTNLGKFFRDLSKNVHVSEQYQWNAEEQKLLEGDPNFVDIKHHLTKPDAATDQQTAEWIKAIRFYRPSQKIRSLVAMNPHGQWAHSSQFIDPNYMWVGLGK